ncbi:diacylglycerol kinase family protein [Paenisporosarcina antarctica]|uniref:Diacylglycerol kinase family protein n=1 Tax=Paenisporosarcina antarctica TaxID=417367 RepID=A0A4P6ZWV8_9BACL|nr:diacylglycerol kinase family protein [Paenisporosarcina antarctica]QBP40872.1 diacylglycerol kinase family protein [Paenisporosarcina antarctica]
MKNSNFTSSFKFAFEGIIHAGMRERNFQFHLFAATVVIISGVFSRLSTIEWILLILCISGMLCLELVNSALERVVDLASPEIHVLAKQAKDMSAAAVLVFACASAIIGVLIFIPKWMEIFN